MAVYKLDLTTSDIGEIITIIRVQKFRLNLDGFAKKFGVAAHQLQLIEDGRSAHGISLLKKVASKYPKHIKINLEVTI
jgi:hypothetical protein